MDYYEGLKEEKNQHMKLKRDYEKALAEIKRLRAELAQYKEETINYNWK
jgi:hypothetical protein